MKTPNPGSQEAQDAGCTCPVIDNHYGKGVEGNFWYSMNCPIHGKEVIDSTPPATAERKK